MYSMSCLKTQRSLTAHRNKIHAKTATTFLKVIRHIQKNIDIQKNLRIQVK